MMRTITTLVAVAMLMPPLTAMASQTTTQTVIGTVQDVEVLTSTYTRKTPFEERVCQTEEVPVYGSSGNEDSSEVTGLIVGGLLGAAAGNALTKQDGAGTVGAVGGALLGREVANSNSNKGKIVGYRQQDVCETRTVYREERIDEITGYQLSIDVGGDIVSLKTSRSYDQGDEINIRMSTTYSVK